ncbi:MAG: helix-turn-helix transcriptional regulator, partial [Firmicutes bacterium]|nr:helix-turn-helix transcriptional regulator [Bacillota bacterium]
MAFGKRLRFFRTRKGLTQKQVGEAAGFKGNTSEVRMAQYETEARTPKEPLIRQ